MRARTLTAALLLLALVAPAAARADEPGLEFVAPETVTLESDSGRTKPVTVWLRNTSATPREVTLTAILEDSDGDPVSGRTATVVPVDEEGKDLDQFAPPAENAITRYRLFLRGSGLGEDVAGRLVATAPSAAPASIELTVAPKTKLSPGVDLLLIVPLILAFALVGRAWASTPKRPRWDAALPALALDFKTSFATTLTVVGALLGTILSSSIAPDAVGDLSKNTFVALNLLFGVAVVAAGVVYAAGTDSVERESTPRVWAYLVACVVTVWATLGQLTLLWVLTGGFGQTEGLSDTAVLFFRVLLVGSGAATWAYTIRNVRWTLEHRDAIKASMDSGIDARAASLL